MKVHNITLKNSSYSIYIETGILSKIQNYVKQIYTGKKVFIVTDETVAKLYLKEAINTLKEYEVETVIIKAGEESKTLECYASIAQQLLDKQIRRNNVIIALGGGVVGDLTGFVASTIYRGIPFINVPTTLLSQMDSSIGGKTGIDFYNRKNILGTFYQPAMVLIDPNTLNTLSKREFANGMGELIKHGAIGNRKLFELLKKHPAIDEEIIYESLSVKKRVVEIDEFDQGERMILNFGHTFGHAIELSSDYKHGECVAIGMLMAIRMGIDLKVTNPKVLGDMQSILESYELPTVYLDYHKYLSKVVYDKKNLAGTINFILLKDIAEPMIYQIKEEQLEK